MDGISAASNYDFEDNSFPGDFTSSGNANWSVVSSTAADGTTYSVQSGNISHNQSTCFEFVTSTSTISFYYSVSSESSYDYLRFYEDGVEITSWAGSIGWSQYNHLTSSSSHTFKWCYTKDGSVSSGSDAAWVDEIVAGLTSVVYTPIDAVDNIESATGIVAGDFYSCALLDDATAKCWGYGADYRMGDASSDNNDEAGKVSDLSDANVLSTAGDSSHTCAVINSGEVKCWGRGDYGKQGDGDTANNATATDVPGVLQEPPDKPLGPGFSQIYVYVYTSDDDTLYATVSGYNASTDTWHTIATLSGGGSQELINDTSPVNTYHQIRIELNDTDNNDWIYYEYDFGDGYNGTSASTRGDIDDIITKN